MIMVLFKETKNFIVLKSSIVVIGYDRFFIKVEILVWIWILI